MTESQRIRVVCCTGAAASARRRYPYQNHRQTSKREPAASFLVRIGRAAPARAGPLRSNARRVATRWAAATRRLHHHCAQLTAGLPRPGVHHPCGAAL